ncbi:protein-L-isoaspartate O-methyltransferase, partial [Mesorhizobium sp. M2A.F.Ca.ET.042.01.1.1]
MNTGIDDREGFAAFLLRLRGRGTAPKALVAAFEATPRRGFLAAQFHSIAWSDGMLPIECGEAIEGADLQAAVIAALH